MLGGLAVAVAGIASLVDAASPSPEQVLGLEHSAAFVTVPGSGSELEIIRLDVLPTNELCNASRIQLFGQPLTGRTSFQEELSGTALISLDVLNNAAPTLTQWSMRCSPSEGSIEVQLETSTREGSFWSIELTLDETKVTRVGAGGSEPWTFFEKTGGDWDSILTVDPEIVDEFTQDEIEDWKVWLPASRLTLPKQKVTEDITFAAKGAPGKKQMPLDREQGLKKECSGWRCFVHDAVDKVQSKACQLYTLRPRPKTEEAVPTMTFVEKLTKMKPLTTIQAASPTPSTAHFIPAPNHDLLVTLSIAALAFTIFSSLGIAVLGARRYVSSDIQRLPYHRESREERLARVANRRRVFKEFFQKLFCGLFGFVEKESYSGPQGRDLRNDGGDSAGENGSTTLEDDIAGFREVASLVESLVTVEEGRGRSFDDERRTQREGDEVPPPSYESDSAEGSMVADGFRYTPGGHGYPQSTPQTSSDRLGYWAK